jgi:hypothetical protein
LRGLRAQGFTALSGTQDASSVWPFSVIAGFEIALECADMETKKRKKTGTPRDARLHLRLSEDEKRRIEAAAEAASEDVSVWLRRIVREHFAREAKRNAASD